MMDVVVGGKYRHYKSKGGADHTYEVIGLAVHSETHETMVVYKPLYDGSKTWLGDASYAVRPLFMWHEDVEFEGQVRQRFILVG